MAAQKFRITELPAAEPGQGGETARAALDTLTDIVSGYLSDQSAKGPVPERDVIVQAIFRWAGTTGPTGEKST